MLLYLRLLRLDKRTCFFYIVLELSTERFAMCELLAMNFNKAARLNGIMPLFQARAKGNPHGWGFARVNRAGGNVWDITKEPVSAVTSAAATKIATDPTWISDIVLGHVRFASCGSHTLLNTHPFELDYREHHWVFAHNGTLFGLIEPNKLTYPVKGETDSEQLLCSVATVLHQLDLDFYNFVELESFLRTFNDDGNMNLVFSDGACTFVYKDKGSAFGLDICPVEPLVADGTLADDAEPSDEPLTGYVVTTHGLTQNRAWKPIPSGSLLVFENGEMIYGKD